MKPTAAIALAVLALTLTGCAHAGPPTIDDCVKANADKYASVASESMESQRAVCQSIKDKSTADEWAKLYG